MKIFKKVLPILGVIVVLFGLFGYFQSKANGGLGLRGPNGIGFRGKPNPTKLVGFTYSYRISRGAGSYTYKIADNEFSYEVMDNEKYAGITAHADEELLAKLKDLYIENESYKWDGYSKSAMNVLDGKGFHINFLFEDGQRCSADGSNCAPENFDQFHAGMQELLKPLADDIVERGKQKKIAEGFPGKVDNVMIYFIQRGKSGSDEYFFSFHPTDSEGKDNLEIRIHSVSGEFLPNGDYKYYGHLDNKYADFSKLDELVEKYQLINWYDYDVAAEDSSNAEWFQVHIGFDDEKRLNAMGTEKPENYDAFRQEFLSYLIEFIDSIKDVYKPYTSN